MTLNSLSLSTQTLYADLLQMAVSADAMRSIGSLSGTFVTKKIKKKTYWYLQYGALGKKIQIYFGPESPQIKQLIANFTSGKAEEKADRLLRAQLCRMILQGGGLAIDTVSQKVLELFANSGLFRAGGVLVGSQAFVCYGNMLGVKWESGTHTHDIDLAYDKSMALVLGKEIKIDLQAVIENAQMGFHPVPSLNSKNPSTSFKMRGKELHVDILTPHLGSKPAQPVRLPALGIMAEPLRYLDYLIEDFEHAVVLSGNGILLNVAQPSRYVWHKLIVMQERSSYWKTKIQKDIAQCAQLMEALLLQRPEELSHAWRQLGKRDPNWQRYAKKGLERVLKGKPELSEIKSIVA